MRRKTVMNNICIITGASAGIGLSTAETFLTSGYTVINLSRRSCPAGNVINISCDLSEQNFLDGIADHLMEHLSKANKISLIHNASRLENDTVQETSTSDFRKILEINVLAPNTLNGFVLPHMQAGSSILYVGSTLSEKAVPRSFSYVTTKHATIGMMRATCQDLAGSQIHTACICPGFTDTEMLRAHVPDEAMESISAMSAFGRLVEPTEIAQALFWASDNAVINGSIIHANLGQIES